MLRRSGTEKLSLTEVALALGSRRQRTPEVAIAQTEKTLPGLIQSLAKMIPGPDAAVKATTAVRVAVSRYLVRSNDSDDLLLQLREAAGLYDMVDGIPPGPNVTVEFADGTTDTIAGEDRWTLREGGSLEISRSCGATTLYSPTHWRSLTHPNRE